MQTKILSAMEIRDLIKNLPNGSTLELCKDTLIHDHKTEGTICDQRNSHCEVTKVFKGEIITIVKPIRPPSFLCFAEFRGKEFQFHVGNFILDNTLTESLVINGFLVKWNEENRSRQVEYIKSIQGRLDKIK